MNQNVAAVYCRLSKEDLDKDSGKTVSESIKNQKSMLESYARDREWTIYDFYIDEDFSGSDRDRPEFNRLITDSHLNRFNVVLCKKQARFARDIEYVEKYIHGLFAERQIRFVAVLDNIDTGMTGRSVRKASQINSLVDEWYLSDLSENIISSLNTKRRNAEFIGSFAPYGYRKNPVDKNSLLIDPEAAETVRIIFERYRNGSGTSKIAQELNSEHVPNPLLYKTLKGEKINPNPDHQTAKRYLWSPSAVSSILHNQTYTGDLIQGKFRKSGYKSKKLLRVPKEDWIIIKSCHERIIDEETWSAVQKRLASGCRFPTGSQGPHPISGMVYCGECGSKLVSSGGRSGRRRTSYLCCSKHNLFVDACIGTRIEASKLEQVILEQFRTLSDLFFDEDALSAQIDSGLITSGSGLERLKGRLRSLRDRAAALEKKKNILYSDKLDGIITLEQFIEFQSQLNSESGSILIQQHTAEAEISILASNRSSLTSSEYLLKRYKSPDVLTRHITELFIESVHVRKRRNGESQEVIINWNL